MIGWGSNELANVVLSLRISNPFVVLCRVVDGRSSLWDVRIAIFLSCDYDMHMSGFEQYLIIEYNLTYAHSIRDCGESPSSSLR